MPIGVSYLVLPDTRLSGPLLGAWRVRGTEPWVAEVLHWDVSVLSARANVRRLGLCLRYVWFFDELWTCFNSFAVSCGSPTSRGMLSWGDRGFVHLQDCRVGSFVSGFFCLLFISSEGFKVVSQWFSSCVLLSDEISSFHSSCYLGVRLDVVRRPLRCVSPGSYLSRQS